MWHNRRYRLIAQRLIRELPEFRDIRENNVRIAYLSSMKEKKSSHRIIHADCHKVEDLYAWCCRYDFFIVFYEPNIAGFTDRGIEALVRHELHHVGIEYTDNGVKYYIVPHDVEEFWDVIREYGIDWSDVEWQGGRAQTAGKI